jgi:hypothetical protein
MQHSLAAWPMGLGSLGIRAAVAGGREIKTQTRGSRGSDFDEITIQACCWFFRGGYLTADV